MKKLDSTRKLQAGIVLRVYKKGFGYSAITVLENNEHYLAATAGDDFYGAVAEGDAVEAYFWIDEIASYEFTLMVLGKILPGRPIVFFGHSETISRSTDRKCLTAQVEIPVKFFVFDTGDDKIITTEEIVFHSGTIVLLTDREAVIKCETGLSVGKFLKGHIEIDGATIEIMGKIDAINDEKNIYNILFVGMHERDQNRILEYLFSIYRE